MLRHLLLNLRDQARRKPQSEITVDKNSEDENFWSQWENILSDSDIKTVPLHLLNELTINLEDSESHTFYIAKMLESGMTIPEITELVEEFLKENEELVDGLDFHINIKAVASEVGVKTRRLLD